MQKDPHHSPAAIAYAQALIELAGDAAAAIGQELGDLRKVIDDLPQFAQILADPAIGKGERQTLIRNVFADRASPLIVNFLLLLNEKGRLGLTASIAGAYDDLLEEKMGVIEVDITTVQALDAGQLQNVQQKVSGVLKRDAVVHQHVDSSILGGLILRVQDQLLDGSVRAQIAAMRRRLMAAKPV